MQECCDDFWACLDELVRTCQVVTDRPKGTAHPRYPEYIYPVDYGYLEGITAADGHGIDIWVGTLEPKEIVGILCTVDMVKRDSEVKSLYGCTPEEVGKILRVQNEKGMRAILVPRHNESEGSAARPRTPALPLI